jgi:hypothetical protein
MPHLQCVKGKRHASAGRIEAQTRETFQSTHRRLANAFSMVEGFAPYRTAYTDGPGHDCNA